MKVYVQKQSQPQQKAALHPRQLAQHKILNQTVPMSSHADAGGRNVLTNTFALPRLAHDFSRIPVHSKAPVKLQAKFKINTPGDIYEQEADRVAEQMMRMPEPPPLQRACVCGGGCSPKGQAEQPHREHSLLQTKPVPASVAERIVSPPVVQEVLRSSGRPLAPTTRAFFAPRFGHDFSQVRVHTDEQAAKSAQAVNALAYTVGHHVVFGAGQYAPGTSDGQRLLAHELAHVVQQSGQQSVEVSRIQRQTATGTTTEKKEEKAEPPQFSYSPKLDPELKARFNRMVIALNAMGITYKVMGDVRPKRQAHLVSTAYHIHTKQVPLKELRALKGGKDLDGNVWYRKGWEMVTPFFSLLYRPRPATEAEILEKAPDLLEKAKENALELAENEGSDFIGTFTFRPNIVNCAYEGYAKDDPHRKPNLSTVPISNHVIGQAIDLKGIEWNKLGGEWSAEARKFVASFGLTRPFAPEAQTYCKKEAWHFELAPDAPKSETPPKEVKAPKK